MARRHDYSAASCTRNRKSDKQRRGKLYLFSLVYILYSSYYMGYMCCIFSVIYFIAYCFITKNNSKLLNENEIFTKKFSAKKSLNYRFVNRALKFAGFSLLAGMICAVVLRRLFISFLKAAVPLLTIIPQRFNHISLFLIL